MSDERPGEAVVAATLSLVTAGLLLITGFVVIFAAGNLQNLDDSTSTSRTTLFVLAGLTNVIAAALLIIGGVLLLGRSTGSRGPLALGALLCLALGVFWLANDEGDNGVLVWLIIFCVPTGRGGDPDHDRSGHRLAAPGRCSSSASAAPRRPAGCARR